ncbi:MAG TPA: hypothetical protein VKC34_13025 [Blastocatellia bacterium]|nr:hypothetical protein [Blastocatellia bacterium]
MKSRLARGARPAPTNSAASFCCAACADLSRDVRVEVKVFIQD